MASKLQAEDRPDKATGRLSPDDLACLKLLDSRVQWLSAWMIHHANHIRPARDGLKVGGHQASCASIATLMSALYFHTLRANDRVAVKPHASPVFHAIQYLLGTQSRDQMERFRALGGAQSYPSRTKDHDGVDFSTGSVGLGVATTAFASITQDYLRARDLMAEDDLGRMIALVGDAELDEGNIHECLIEGAKHALRNTWWIIDYNRQSLDAVSPDIMFTRFGDIFEAAGWNVIELKYGRALQAAFEKPGGGALKNWIDSAPNALYSMLSYQGGANWRNQLSINIGSSSGVKGLLQDYDDFELAGLMTNLAGHDMDSVTSAFDSVAGDERPQCFIAYTVKGFGMPFQGHKDNHAGLMSPEQMERYRVQMGVPEGREWEPFAGAETEEPRLKAFLSDVAFAKRERRPFGPALPVPGDEVFSASTTAVQSTQQAFGRIMMELGRSDTPLAERVLTMSPDVTVSTNLGGWVNQRSVFKRTAEQDNVTVQDIDSAQKWQPARRGQHLELGIAENNLFLALGAMGLSHAIFGERLLPVGTVYDPFILRGLDALNYACYQDARFMLVATPSGIALAPEGGAHQSIATPVIGMAQDKLAYFEPAFVDELAAIMRWGFTHMQADDGGSVYLRLSTRPLTQIDRRATPHWREQVLKGAYWQRPPSEDAPMVIAYTGVVAPEALGAYEALAGDFPGIGLLAVPSPDLAHRDWRAARLSGDTSHIEALLEALPRDCAIVSVIDGTPGTLSWLGSVHGHLTIPLGVDRFGQSGDLPDLFREYGIDTEAILNAAEEALG